MNNKYGYRLVDILKRGRGCGGRTLSHPSFLPSPPPPFLSSPRLVQIEGSKREVTREGDQSESETREGGVESSLARCFSILQSLRRGEILSTAEILYPRIATQRDQSIAAITEPRERRRKRREERRASRDGVPRITRRVFDDAYDRRR